MNTDKLSTWHVRVASLPTATVIFGMGAIKLGFSEKGISYYYSAFSAILMALSICNSQYSNVFLNVYEISGLFTTQKCIWWQFSASICVKW